MVMYKFKKLHGQYRISITTNSIIKSSYSAVCEVNAEYSRIKDCYLFELQSRTSVAINGKEPAQIIDKFMLRLSDTYYPIKLLVEPNGRIIDIINLKEIKNRWCTEVSTILKAERCLAYEQYIDLAKANFADSTIFISALERDSFIQFFFKTDMDILNATCYNFPKKDITSYYSLKKDADSLDIGSCSYISQNKDYSGKVLYEFSQYGDILSCKGDFTYRDNDSLYMKAFEINTLNRNIK